MVDIRPVGADCWQEVRNVRLAALADAPFAFGSTYAREAAFVEADWRRRLEADRAVTFLAYRADVEGPPVGIAGGFFDGATGANEVECVSMWVDSHARRGGSGADLVAAVVGWARIERADRVHLWVTESNEPARRLYERCGFTYTDEQQPLPSDPTLDELGMVRSLS